MFNDLLTTVNLIPEILKPVRPTYFIVIEINSAFTNSRIHK